MAEKKQLSSATGKRKTAVARVRLLPGSGAITVNKRGFEDYFPRETARMRILEPLQITETATQYDIFEPLRPTLRKAGMLTRDPRAVERKKYGRHKARKRPQYSKR
jgi:small subunit ribosomal protein S9